MLPSSSIHSTWQLPRVAGLFAIARAGRVHQGRFSLAPTCPPVRRPPGVGLVGKEYLRSSTPRLVPPGGVIRHEGFPLVLIRLDQPLLGPLQDKPQTVQVVQATAPAQADTEVLPEKLPHHLPVPLAISMPDISGNSCTPFNSACCASPRAGGNLRTVENQGPRPALAEGGSPPSDGVGIPSQSMT